jgi:hypothetical protein
LPYGSFQASFSPDAKPAARCAAHALQVHIRAFIALLVVVKVEKLMSVKKAIHFVLAGSVGDPSPISSPADLSASTCWQTILKHASRGPASKTPAPAEPNAGCDPRKQDCKLAAELRADPARRP